VQKHLLARLPRSPEALREAVARLDRASLAFGKAITKRLADQVLLDGGWAVSPADEVSMSGVDPSCQPPGLL
jgi:chromosomal replication initiation ATPase DnaA